jgi:formylglycine-generating enzyme required for sulfatase activity
VTAWSHGSDAALLGYYAWYVLNSTATMHPVGTWKPNGLGLFDAHGNAWQWCQDAYDGPTNKDHGEVRNAQKRVLRGGAFHRAAELARSASRGSYLPALRRYNGGFRVARTYR